MMVRDLAHAGDRPTIRMVARAADGANHNPAGVVRLDDVQAIRAARRFGAHDMNLRHPLGPTLALGRGWSTGRGRRAHAPMSQMLQCSPHRLGECAPGSLWVLPE